MHIGNISITYCKWDWRRIIANQKQDNLGVSPLKEDGYTQIGPRSAIF